MKRFASVVFALFAVLCAAAAQEQNNPAVRTQPMPWDFVQIGFWEGFPTNQNTAMCAGVRVGVPVCGGDAGCNGFELGLLGGAGSQVNGLQIGILATDSDHVNGVTIAPVNICDRVNGLQIGIVNVAKDRTFQIGLVNVVSDGWLPFCIGLNFNF